MDMINIHFINVWNVIKIKNELKEYMVNIFSSYVRELCSYMESQIILTKLVLKQSAITCLWSYSKVLVGRTMRF